MTDYDKWLDKDMEEWYGEEESEDLETEDFDGPYPEDDYHIWDDIQ